MLAVLATLVLGGFTLAMFPGASEAQDRATDASYTAADAVLPLPRFVSLKADRVNVRRGPGRDHDVVWVFNKAGLPVEVVAEFENWRRIRDSEGAEGWIHHALLSSRRTALVKPWASNEMIALRRDSAGQASVAAWLQPGVLVDVERCNGNWCRAHVGEISGWIRQDALWGVYANEVAEY